MLVYEVFPRSFKDRRALGAFVGLTGTPYNSGSSKTEQRISENGNARVRRMLSQLAWRWLGHQPESALAQWFNAGLGGALSLLVRIVSEVFSPQFRADRVSDKGRGSKYKGKAQPGDT